MLDLGRDHVLLARLLRAETPQRQQRALALRAPREAHALQVERSRHESFSEEDYEPIARFRKISAQLLEENRKMVIPEVIGIQIEESPMVVSSIQGSTSVKDATVAENVPKDAFQKKSIKHSESIDSDPIYRPFEANHQSQNAENVL